MKIIDERERDILPLIVKLGPVHPELSSDAMIAEVHKRSLAAWDSRVSSVALSAFPMAPTEFQFGTSAWMTAQAAYEAEFKRAMESGSVFSVYLNEALAAIDAAFTMQRDTLRLSRFKKAQSALKHCFSHTFGACVARESAKVSAIATHGAASSAVASWILWSCVAPAFGAVRHLQASPDASLLTEDDATAAERQRLVQLTRNAASARVTLAGLRETLGASGLSAPVKADRGVAFDFRRETSGAIVRPPSDAEIRTLLAMDTRLATDRIVSGSSAPDSGRRQQSRSRLASGPLSPFGTTASGPEPNFVCACGYEFGQPMSRLVFTVCRCGAFV